MPSNLTIGLASYWPFDGSLVDVNGALNLSLTNGAISYVAGVIAQAMQADTNAAGNSSIVQNATAVAINESTSYSAQVWIKDPGNALSGQSISNDNPNQSRFDLGTYGNGDGTAIPYFAPVLNPNDVYMEGAAVSGSSAHHILGVADAELQQFRLYVDGVLANSINRSLPWTHTNPQYNAVLFSGSKDTGSPFADESCIWIGNAISISDITWLYNGGAGRTYAEIAATGAGGSAPTPYKSFRLGIELGL